MFRPRQAAMKRCKKVLSLDREWDVFRTLLSTLTNWHASVRTTLTSTQKWNGGSGSDPIGDIQARIVASYQPITDIWFNQKVAFEFLGHAKVKDHMRQFYGDRGVEQIASNVAAADKSITDFAIPGFPPFHVVAAKAKNSSGVPEYILPDHTILTVSPPGVPQDDEEVATSYTFRLREETGVGYVTREYFVEGRGPHGGTMIVCSQEDIAVMTGVDDSTTAVCGGFIQNCYQ